MKSHKKFPCPYCKGKYLDTDYIDGYTVELGRCNACTYGQIEVDSPQHVEIKIRRVAIEAISAFGPKDAAWPYEILLDIGAEIQKVVASRMSAAVIEEEK